MKAGRRRRFLFPPDPHVDRVTNEELQNLVEEATADFATDDPQAALVKLARATAAAPDLFEAWHALAEVNLSLRRLDEALAAAERAHALRPADLFINTTLSRIWVERGTRPRPNISGRRRKSAGGGSS